VFGPPPPLPPLHLSARGPIQQSGRTVTTANQRDRPRGPGRAHGVSSTPGQPPGDLSVARPRSHSCMPRPADRRHLAEHHAPPARGARAVLQRAAPLRPRRQILRDAAALALALLLATPASASVVLVLRSDTGVLVAADTLGHSGGDQERTFPYCKVFASEDTIVAFAGLNGIPALGLDLREPIRRVLARGLPYRQFLRALDKELTLFLPVLVSTALIVPGFEALLEQGRGHFLTILVAGLDEGQPAWRVRRYAHVVTEGKARLRQRDARCGAKCPPGRKAVLDGTRRMQRAFLDADLGVLQAQWPTEAGRFIGMAAREAPKTIGLPAVSLELTPAGVRWLERAPACEP
jgi:hypothetical protein